MGVCLQVSKKRGNRNCEEGHLEKARLSVSRIRHLWPYV